MIRFIAIDPSSTVTGWAVFEGDNLVAWGTIKTEKLEYAARFPFIVQELNALAERYRFFNIAIEETKFAWGTGRQRNIAGLQVVFKVIKEWAASKKFPFMAYNVATWKNNVTGSVHATKELTAANICLRFPAVPTALSEHEYDAIAIGVNHAGVMKTLEAVRDNPGAFVDSLDGKNRVALAKTGIEALVDEATRYQEVRSPDELKKRLKKHLKGEGEC